MFVRHGIDPTHDFEEVLKGDGLRAGEDCDFEVSSAWNLLSFVVKQAEDVADSDWGEPAAWEELELFPCESRDLLDGVD